MWHSKHSLEALVANSRCSGLLQLNCHLLLHWDISLRLSVQSFQCWCCACRTFEVAQQIWAQTFKYLADNNVLFEGILLKPSMVTPGADSGKKVSNSAPALCPHDLSWIAI